MASLELLPSKVIGEDQVSEEVLKGKHPFAVALQCIHSVAYMAFEVLHACQHSEAACSKPRSYAVTS